MAFTACFCSHDSAFSLDIILTNDDGFESAYTHAVYRQLKSAGHRVMISGPAQNQSGMGTSSSFGRIESLTNDTRAGSIKADSPGIGSLPEVPDVHYVDSTPGCSVLYALDKLVPEHWGKEADLVISGPNYGYNLGSAAMDSGTIAAARYAISRGVPAIAVSDGHKPMELRGYQKLAEGDIEFEIVDLVVRLVTQLETCAKEFRTPLLPSGLGLNVNIPAFLPGESGSLRFVMTRLGLQMGVYFSEDISQDPNVKAFGLDYLPGPGFSFAGIVNPPKPPLPIDSAPDSEWVAFSKGDITVSVIQGMPQAGAEEELAVRKLLLGLPLRCVERNSFPPLAE